MLSFASVPSCFYLLRIRLIFRVQPKCFLLNICLLYISLYPLCYVFDSHPQSSQIAIGSLSLVHVYESWKVLRILSALFFIGCYLYYIYPTHTDAYTHIHAIWTRCKSFPPLHRKTCTNAASLHRTSLRRTAWHCLMRYFSTTSIKRLTELLRQCGRQEATRPILTGFRIFSVPTISRIWCTVSFSPQCAVLESVWQKFPSLCPFAD